MSVPPPHDSTSGSALEEYRISLDAERSWARLRGGDDALVLSALGATFEHERMLRGRLQLPLGMLQVAAVERGSTAGDGGRFPVLRRLSRTAVVPREHGVEGWLWTRSGGSALTVLGDTDSTPNAALLFTKPLAEDLLTGFDPVALADIAARSPLGAATVYGLLFRVADPSAAEVAFRRFGLLRPLTDREVPPTLRRWLPRDQPVDAALLDDDAARAPTSVAPPGMG